MTGKNKNSDSNSRKYLTILLLGFLYVTGAWLSFYKSNGDDIFKQWSVVILLSFPLLMLSGFAFKLFFSSERKNSFPLIWYVVFTIAPLYITWILYSCKIVFNVYGIFIIAFMLCVSFSVVIFSTRNIMKNNDNLFVRFVVTNKMNSLLFFLGNFICVAYLFGFLLGVNDQRLHKVGKRSLYVNPESIFEKTPKEVYEESRAIRSESDPIQEKIKKLDFVKQIYSNNDLKHVSKIDDLERIFFILIPYLEILSKDQVDLINNRLLDILNISDENIKTYITKKNELNKVLNEGKLKDDSVKSITEIIEGIYYSRTRFSGYVKFNIGEPGLDRIDSEEDRIIEEMVNYLSKNKDNRRHVIVLVGRTNKQKPSGKVTEERSNFMTNYELSEFRTITVKSLIIEKLIKKEGYWPNLEWQILPVGNENVLTNTGNGTGVTTDNATESAPSVQIMISMLPNHLSILELDHHKTMEIKPKLHLLEYLYFMIYTITTTGYGDILPVSAFSKTISTIANIFEVFYIVIFFNILLSLKISFKNLSVDEAESKYSEILLKIENQTKLLKEFMKGNFDNDFPESSAQKPAKK